MATSQFTIYRSSDIGAPVLNGLSGSLVNVFSQILVTGYGSKPAAGWIIDYTSSDASGSTFRAPSGSSNSLYLSVDDRNREGSYGWEGAMVSGLEEASLFNTGSAWFPAPSQWPNSNGLRVIKNGSTSKSRISSSIPWICFADAYTLYFFPQPDFLTDRYYPFLFGDFYSFKEGDSYNCIIVAAINQSIDLTSNFQDMLGKYDKNCGGHFVARSYTGGEGSITVGKHGTNSYYLSDTTNYMITKDYQDINPMNNGIFMSPLFIHEPTASAIRGKFRGLYYMAVSQSVVNGENFSGSGIYAGKTFMVLRPSVNAGVWAIETSNTVDTN